MKSLSDSEFTTIEQIKQGATTLNSILSGTAANEVTGSMLDMEGRKSAVTIMEVIFLFILLHVNNHLILYHLILKKKMANSFATADVPDPNKILDFVETSTSSVAAVFEVSNMI